LLSRGMQSKRNGQKNKSVFFVGLFFYLRFKNLEKKMGAFLSHRVGWWEYSSASISLPFAKHQNRHQAAL